ncbi:hypothetical protein BDV12DRAFT_170646 [Aspergillus spectabilis]
MTLTKEGEKVKNFQIFTKHDADTRNSLDDFKQRCCNKEMHKGGYPQCNSDIKSLVVLLDSSCGPRSKSDHGYRSHSIDLKLSACPNNESYIIAVGHSGCGLLSRLSILARANGASPVETRTRNCDILFIRLLWTRTTQRQARSPGLTPFVSTETTGI